MKPLEIRKKLKNTWPMDKILFFCGILVSRLLVSEACHASEDERRKRQANMNEIDADDTNMLRQYFRNCMRSKLGEIWEWESVVDVTVLDTAWYEGSDQSFCSAPSQGDNATCWINRLSTYLETRSYLFDPARQCIQQYESDALQGTIETSSLAFQEPSTSPVLCMEVTEDAEPFFPNSPVVRSYSSCNQEQSAMPSNRPSLDFPSVFQFVQGHTLCSPELSGCNDDNTQSIVENEPDVPNWPYRFEAITKSTSPLSSAISSCNQQIFPTRSDWSAWTDCPVTCGGGTRTRSRECSEPGCATMESDSCSQELCPRCSISMFSRRRCGGMGLSRDACLQQDCCFQRGSCYRSMREDRNPNAFFRPTEGPSSGVVQSGPGKVVIECNEANALSTCSSGANIGRQDCGRFLCCWSSTFQRCYPASITITEVTDECDEGFEDPPACREIDDCSPNPCQNGGRCIDRTLSFECDCVAPCTGNLCETCQGTTVTTIATTTENPLECTNQPPFPNNGGIIETLSLPVSINSMVTYQCDNDITLTGSTTNTCNGNDIWQNSAPTCRGCFQQIPLPPLLVSSRPHIEGVYGPPPYRIGFWITLACKTTNSGNEFVSVSQRNECLNSGNWMITNPICDFCSALPGPCDPNAICANNAVSFTCTCRPGFTGDGFSCS